MISFIFRFHILSKWHLLLSNVWGFQSQITTTDLYAAVCWVMRQQTGSTHHAVLAVPTVVDGFADRGHQHATDAIAAART